MLAHGTHERKSLPVPLALWQLLQRTERVRLRMMLRRNTYSCQKPLRTLLAGSTYRSRNPRLIPWIFCYYGTVVLFTTAG